MIEMDETPLEEYTELPAEDRPKLFRCMDFNEKIGGVPRCYWENTSKEELVLEHVLEYAR